MLVVVCTPAGNEAVRETELLNQCELVAFPTDARSRQKAKKEARHVAPRRAHVL